MKDIHTVQPICEHKSLAEIYCLHEDLKQTNWLRETFFIDKDGKTVAHFKQNFPFLVKQLTPKHCNLFVMKNFNDDIYHIIQVFNSYEDIEFGVENGCFAVKNNGLWGFINEEAEEIIEPQYDDYCAFCCGLAAVCKNGKWGFINKQNEVIVPFEYEIPEYSCFNEFYAPVGKNGKFGLIDQSGRIFIPFKFDATTITFRYSKIFPVKINNKWGFIDKYEKIIIPFEYDAIEPNNDGCSLYTVIKNVGGKESLGLVNPIEGKIIIPCEYNSLCVNKNSVCAGMLCENGKEKFGLLDFENNKITDFIYDKIDDYVEDSLYCAKLTGNWGYIDEEGRVAIGFKYKEAEPFCGGYAVVKNHDGTKDIINRKDKVIFRTFSENKVYNLGAKMFLIQEPELKNYELVKLKE